MTLEPIVLGNIEIERNYDLQRDSFIAIDINETYKEPEKKSDIPSSDKAAKMVMITSSIAEYSKRFGEVKRKGSLVGNHGNRLSSYSLNGLDAFSILCIENQRHNVFLMDFLIKKDNQEHDKIHNYISDLKSFYQG